MHIPSLGLIALVHATTLGVTRSSLEAGGIDATYMEAVLGYPTLTAQNPAFLWFLMNQALLGTWKMMEFAADDM